MSFRNRGGRCNDPFVTFLQNFPSQATIISTTTYDYVLHDHETIQRKEKKEEEEEEERMQRRFRRIRFNEVARGGSFH